MVRPFSLSFKPVLAAALAALVGAGAHAATFQNDSGLAGATTVEAFDKPDVPPGTLPGTLFDGVTFSDNLVLTSLPSGGLPSFGGQALANFSPDRPFGEIRFAGPVRGAGFAMLMFPGDAQFSAYLGQQLVEQATLRVGYEGNYVGFTGITFDRIVFGNADNRTGMMIDNLQIAAVPEPQSVALMAMGLLAIGAVSRRRAAARN